MDVAVASDEPLHQFTWLLGLGFTLAFIMAASIGANDVANNIGTVYGSGVLSLKRCLILSSIFELLGAVLIGGKVSDTIRSGIVDPEVYNDKPGLFMAGQVSALGATAVWLAIATYFRMPVSGTHSIVGAILGFTLVGNGVAGIYWITILKISIAWIVSPILSGLTTAIMFVMARRFILNSYNPVKSGLTFLPFIYGILISINLFSIFYEGTPVLKFDLIPWWGAVILSFGTGIIVAILVRVFFVPWMKERLSPDNDMKLNDFPRLSQVEIEGSNAQTKNVDLDAPPAYSECANDNMDDTNMYIDQGNTSQMNAKSSENSSNNIETLPEEDRRESRDSTNDNDNEPKTEKLFSLLQILSAIFASFAHGGNDVSNAIGPLLAIFTIWQTGLVSQENTPQMWILAYGGTGILAGLWLFGRRVIETVAHEITHLTPSRGFFVELGAAATVLLASNIGIPISTTHCKIGSVVAVGIVSREEPFEWAQFKVKARNFPALVKRSLICKNKHELIVVEEQAEEVEDSSKSNSSPQTSDGEEGNANVNWKLFRTIILAWAVTVPAACGISALMFFGFKQAV